MAGASKSIARCLVLFSTTSFRNPVPILQGSFFLSIVDNRITGVSAQNRVVSDMAIFRQLRKPLGSLLGSLEVAVCACCPPKVHDGIFPCAALFRYLVRRLSSGNSPCTCLRMLTQNSFDMHL